MLVRPHAATILASSLLALPMGAGTSPSPEPARLVVQNDTYSSLQVTLIDEDGRQIRLGQAPPDFANTLLIAEPLPEGEVRFAARLLGQSQVLYRSDPVRLASGLHIRWRLPANTLDY